MITPYSVGTTEAKVASIQEDRTSLIILNNHGTATIYYRDTKGVAIANGLPIAPNGNLVLKIPEDDPRKEAWVVSDTLATDVRVYEGFGLVPKEWRT